MSTPIKPYSHDIDLLKNRIINVKIQPVSTVERNTLGATLGIDDTSLVVFDKDLKSPYWWNGLSWSSGLGGVTSVFGRTGSITAETGDYAAFYYPLISNPAGYLTSFTETDPIFSSSPSFSISNTDISNWNTAFSWGNHAGLYPLLTGSYSDPSWITSLDWSKIIGTPSSLWTKSGTTLYPATTGDKIGLGTINIAESYTHYGTLEGEYPIIIQPSNYGTVYPYSNSGMTETVADRFYIGGYALNEIANSFYDNRPDVVVSYLAYNSNAAGARINTGDGAFRFAAETHYFVNGANPHFEFHTPEVTLYDGTTVRLKSSYINKYTGQAFTDNRNEGELWYSLRAGVAGIGVPTVGFHSALSTGVFGDFTIYGEALAPYGGRLTFNHDTNGNSTIWSEGTGLVFNNYAFEIYGGGTTAHNMFKGSVGIGGSGNPVDFNTTRVVFEIQSTTKASIPAPIMTTVQRDSISVPSDAMIVYNLDTHSYNYHNGTTWTNLSGSSEESDYIDDLIGTNDGINTDFQTSSNFITGTTKVYWNGARLTRGSSHDYVEVGNDTIRFNNAPTANSNIVVDYTIL